MKQEQANASFQPYDVQYFDSLKFAKMLQRKERPSRWRIFWQGIEQKRKDIKKELLKYRSGTGNL